MHSKNAISKHSLKCECTIINDFNERNFSCQKSKSRLATSKKLVKSSKSPKTPGRVSPRKSSKSYSHVQGSGYGITTPWKSLAKKKSDEKQQTGKFACNLGPVHLSLVT